MLRCSSRTCMHPASIGRTSAYQSRCQLRLRGCAECERSAAEQQKPPQAAPCCCRDSRPMPEHVGAAPAAMQPASLLPPPRRRLQVPPARGRVHLPPLQCALLLPGLLQAPLGPLHRGLLQASGAGAAAAGSPPRCERSLCITALPLPAHPAGRPRCRSCAASRRGRMRSGACWTFCSACTSRTWRAAAAAAAATRRSQGAAATRAGCPRRPCTACWPRYP